MQLVSDYTQRGSNSVANMETIITEWEDCKKCLIGGYAYRHVFIDYVPSQPGTLLEEVYTPKAEIMMIGEGPGKGEDAIGTPFVGVAGALLRSTIASAWEHFSGRVPDEARPVIALTNLLACRPCNYMGGPNREPAAIEIEKCSPRLVETIRIHKPHSVVCLGNIPQMYAPAIVGRIRHNCAIHHVKHPSAVARQGGVQSPYYQEYLQRFIEVYHVALKMREVLG